MTTKYPDRMNLWCSRDTVEKLKQVCTHMEHSTYETTGMKIKISQGTAVDALINQYLATTKKK